MPRYSPRFRTEPRLRNPFTQTSSCMVSDGNSGHPLTPTARDSTQWTIESALDELPHAGRGAPFGRIVRGHSVTALEVVIHLPDSRVTDETYLRREHGPYHFIEPGGERGRRQRPMVLPAFPKAARPPVTRQWHISRSMPWPISSARGTAIRITGLAREAYDRYYSDGITETVNVASTQLCEPLPASPPC